MAGLDWARAASGGGPAEPGRGPGQGARPGPDRGWAAVRGELRRRRCRQSTILHGSGRAVTSAASPGSSPRGPSAAAPGVSSPRLPGPPLPSPSRSSHQQAGVQSCSGDRISCRAGGKVRARSVAEGTGALQGWLWAAPSTRRFRSRAQRWARSCSRGSSPKRRRRSVAGSQMLRQGQISCTSQTGDGASGGAAAPAAITASAGAEDRAVGVAGAASGCREAPAPRAPGWCGSVRPGVARVRDPGGGQGAAKLRPSSRAQPSSGIAAVRTPCRTVSARRRIRISPGVMSDTALTLAPLSLQSARHE